jgi:hypothetical protein
MIVAQPRWHARRQSCPHVRGPCPALPIGPTHQWDAGRTLAPLPMCLLPIIVGTVGPPPHHILRQGDPLWSAAGIPKTLHKNAYALKKQKLTQSYENELEQTHPGADDPFP